MLTLRITLKEHLARLRAAEREARRLLPAAARRAPSAVPALSHLAAACGVDTSTMSLFANNRREDVDRVLVACVARVLRERGFPAEVTDLLALVLAEEPAGETEA